MCKKNSVWLERNKKGESNTCRQLAKKRASEKKESSKMREERPKIHSKGSKIDLFFKCQITRFDFIWFNVVNRFFPLLSSLYLLFPFLPKKPHTLLQKQEISMYRQHEKDTNECVQIVRLLLFCMANVANIRRNTKNVLQRDPSKRGNQNVYNFIYPMLGGF